ncbi:unnamed protein product [Closterium sp. NIES-64]|nr:unnamed protein product [Closterium sp. NIES-64]CAI5990130.1 unnamed protein product [Closterium sp. NIES-64]
MSSGKSSRPSTKSVLGPGHNENIHDIFDIGQQLGAGQFGTTYVCTERETGVHWACKTIPKSKLLTEDDVEDVRREVAILYHVQDSPNIVNIRGAYEDRDFVHIVMELCTGGELYDTIIDRIEAMGVPYTEHDAAELARVIVRVVETCHSLGVVHRDLKPENFLLSSTNPDAELKATDFGLSAFYKGEGLSRHCGSPMYMAPEVVRWRPGALGAGRKPPKYGPEVDIWSAGVIIYALLSGFPPFYHSSHSSKEIFKAVLKGNPSFTVPPWPEISDQAKHLVSWMLQSDPAMRPTAHEVLCHPWLGDPGIATQEPLPPVVLSRLKQFTSMVKLKRVAMKVIAEGLKEEEIAGLKEMFEMMDTDGSGTITLDELRVGLKKVGGNLTDEEIEKIMEETDIDHSGEIEYGEFLAATLHLSKIDKQENLLKAFEYFDADGSGTITLDELQKACEELRLSKDEIMAMMEEIDENNDGTIDYNEFVQMMRKTQTGGMSRRDIMDGNMAATQAAARTDPASQSQREASEQQQRVPLRAMVHECMQRWFRQTQSEAESGVAPMQTLLAQMYLSGYGVKADAAKGKEWLKKAAERDGQARIMLRSINAKSGNTAVFDDDF